MSDGVDHGKRRTLTIAAGVWGGVGAACAVVPFVSSMQPSARAQAAGAPVEVDITRLEPGQRVTVEWRGKPVWIIKRTKAMLDELPNMETLLRDPKSEENQQPKYTRNSVRSIKAEVLVLVGICTHLGCSPLFRPDVGAEDLGPNWKGGFFCPCHGSSFDMAGRVFQGVPAPTNLEVPPHRYLTENQILIGVDPEEAV